MNENIKEMTAEDLIFEKHYEYYKSIGIETIKQQAGQVEQVSSDYQGRVLYELLQNAFDKAEKNILIMVRGNSLYVANDGEKFSFVADYDYERNSSKRGDFQSMCSMSTSTKNADTAIGNKGVGFKSVFSISESGFVNVFTRGVILQDDNITPETISFRIYDSYKDTDNIPKDFSESLKLTIKEKINLVQKEFEDRGIPGYYFPFHITSEASDICELFEDGYVSIIQIPFKNKVVIKELFEDIEKVHFQFIQLKQNREFKIEFRYEDETHIKEISKESPMLFSTVVESDKLSELAKAAGISTKHPKVAFFIRENEGGQIYNYLPTKVESPFKYVDFHADFHTTVDRKSINFDGEIGLYNKALLRACLELYFVTLNGYLDENEKVELDLKYINNKVAKIQLTDFNWHLLDIEKASLVLAEVRSILIIWNTNSYYYSYKVASSLLAKLAKKYFLTERKPEQHVEFFKVTDKFINSFAKNVEQTYMWFDYFKESFAKELIWNQARIIPNVILSESTELLYRKKNDSILRLPPFLGINITDFEIEDEPFRKKLGIKEFSDYNEILKYYRQVSLKGEVSNVALTELQQKELLLSVAQMIGDKEFDSTQRYSDYINRKQNVNTVKNIADFAVSTLFLKTINRSIEGKPLYKPAQFCYKSELDNEFIEGLDNNLLHYLGVSFECENNSKYLYIDKAIYTEQLKDGLDYIPSLWRRGGSDDDLVYEKVLNNIAVAYNEIVTHPALINEDYTFFTKIRNVNRNEELKNMLVNRYDIFPKTFTEILKFHISETINKSYIKQDEIIKFYQRVFHDFHRSGDYLIMLKGKVNWTKSTDFIIMPSKQYFERFSKSYMGNISCYYLNRDLSNVLTEQQAKIKSGDIEIQAINDERNKSMKEDLEIKIPFILARISNERNSDYDFIYEGNRYEEIQNKVSRLKFIYGSGLKQAIELNGNGKILILDEDKKFAIKENLIYIDDSASKKDIAEAINYYLFNSSIIAEAIEIILYKSIETLNKDFDTTEMSAIYKRWKPDFQKKWIEFQKEILGSYISDIVPIPSDWYCYTYQSKSELLIRIEREEGLFWFEEKMNLAKANYEGYFDSFKLEIENPNEDKIAKLNHFLLAKNDEDSKMFLNRIGNIIYKLGIEEILDIIEMEIENKYDDYMVFNDPKGVKIQKIKLKISNKVNEIFNKMSSQFVKEITNNTLHTSDSTFENIKTNVNKKIFKTDSFGNKIEIDYESLGASGEIDVLNYYINEFIKLPYEERKVGIDQVYELLETKVGDKDLLEYKTKCIECIENDLELKRALIPFFYVTLHFKYAYFDLIVYKDGKPTLVEVKTTHSERNNRFFFSIAEVNASRGLDEYEIVRVTDNSISFLGNPIKLVEDKISSIKADTFSLTPRNYEFNFIKN